MKKLMFGLVLAGLVVCGAGANERVRWPVWLAINKAESVDVAGLRLDMPEGTCDQVVGIDLGWIGHVQDFYGLGLNLWNNDVSGALFGLQLGAFNTAATGDAAIQVAFCRNDAQSIDGIQVALWKDKVQTINGVQVALLKSEAQTAIGIQVALLNDTVYGNALQVGLNNRAEDFTGIALGAFGRAQYFGGIQANLLRNHVTESLMGCQLGISNTTPSGELLGVQVGLWNEAQTLNGFQVGLINKADFSDGFQIGLVNHVEDMRGYQIGLVNIIRGSEVPFCPILNVGF